MRPKGKLFALFAVFAAIGLVTASGAFTTVEAQRTADVDVAGDDAALLAVEETTGENADYFDSSGDQAELDFSAGSAVNGDGLNLNAETNVENVINITNQGSQAVGVSITKSDASNGEHVAFYTADQEASETGASSFTGGDLAGSSDDIIDLADTVDDGDDDSAGDPARLDGSENSVTLDPGESVTVSLFIDTTDDDLSANSGLVNEITITASADDAPSASDNNPDGDGTIGGGS